MSYIFYAWLATIAYGFLAIIGKFSTKHHIVNPWLFNFIWTFFSFVLLLPLAFVYHIGFPKEWFFLTLASLCNAIWFILYAFSLYRLDVSVLTPLYNFRAVFAVILSALFLNEHLVPFQIILFIIIFIAGAFVSLDEKFHIKSFLNSSVALLTLGMFFLATSNVLTNITLKQNSLWETNVWLSLLTVVFLLPTLPLLLKDAKKTSINHLTPLLLMALTFVVGLVASNEAFKENVGISTIIISLPISLFFVFIISIFKPDLLERHTLKVYLIRFTATVIMIIAAIKLAS